MSGKSILSIGLSLLSWTVSAQDAARHIEVRPGTLPVILTVPHGGDLKPESLLSRRYGVTAQDAHTVELSLMISEELEARYGGRPHLVICLLHRSKVDCNRGLEEAAQGDPRAAAAWTQFHDAAEAMEKQVTQKYGTGLTLDIHGHRHEEARVELGYLITGSKLNTTDQALDQDGKLPKMTSIRDLDKRSPQSFAGLVRGPKSLGALLENQEFPAIPSPAHPSPGKSVYFSGAYDITAHGSRDEGTISAIQIECPWVGVRDKEQNRRRFAKALAIALGQYFELHFQMPLASKP